MMWPLRKKSRFAMMKEQAPPVVFRLRFQLSELYTGVEKMVTFGPGGPMIHEIRNLCDACNSDALRVKIPAGARKGDEIVFPGLGPAPIGMIPGDLIFIVEEEPHPVFARKGLDLVATLKIPLVDFLTRNSFAIETLDHRALTVSIAKPGQVTIIRNEGMEIPGLGMKGSLIVRFEIVVPDDLSFTESEKDALERMLSKKSSAFRDLVDVVN